MAKVVVTGSAGTIGSIITPYLASHGYDVLGLDIKGNPPVNIFNDHLEPHFQGAHMIVHLAAHASPFIPHELAQQNLFLTRRVIQAASNAHVPRIVNASSINVYPYQELFETGQHITTMTPTSPNKHWGSDEYGIAKLAAEEEINKFVRASRGSGINLRLGAVTKDDQLASQDPVEPHIHLYHRDLQSIMLEAVRMQGQRTFVCVSRSGFVEDDIRFKIK